MLDVIVCEATVDASKVLAEEEWDQRVTSFAFHAIWSAVAETVTKLPLYVYVLLAFTTTISWNVPVHIAARPIVMELHGNLAPG